MMTPEDLAKLTELEEAASAGEWKAEFWDYRDGMELRGRRLRIEPPQEGIDSNYPLDTEHGRRADANYTLIAAARNALPELLAIAAAHLKLCSAIAYLHDECHLGSRPDDLIKVAKRSGWTWPANEEAKEPLP